MSFLLLLSATARNNVFILRTCSLHNHVQTPLIKFQPSQISNALKKNKGGLQILQTFFIFFRVAIMNRWRRLQRMVNWNILNGYLVIHQLDCLASAQSFCEVCIEAMITSVIYLGTFMSSQPQKHKYLRKCSDYHSL